MNLYPYCPHFKAPPTVTRAPSIHMIKRKLQPLHVIIEPISFQMVLLLAEAAVEKRAYYKEAIADFTYFKKQQLIYRKGKKEFKMKFYSCFGPLEISVDKSDSSESPARD